MILYGRDEAKVNYATRATSAVRAAWLVSPLQDTLPPCPRLEC